MPEHFEDHHFPEEEKPSKSQRKRDMTALQKMGEALVKLSASQLAQIPLDPTLATAIKEARTLTAHGARRRQLQYIGRLMRNIDAEPIENALAKIALHHQKSNALFHKVEQWRDQLIEKGDEKLEELMKQFPEMDRQQVRQLIRNAQQKKAGADTELFRYLRSMMEET